MISYLIWFVSSTVATGLFALGMRAPKRALIPTSLLAGVGYTIYMLVTNAAGSEPLAIFLATLMVAIGSEILATLMKMPATIFMFPGIVPLVPGIGIYRTMLYLLQKKFDLFLDQGTGCIVVLGVMAVAIALTNEVARWVHGGKRHEKAQVEKMAPERVLPVLRAAQENELDAVFALWREAGTGTFSTWNEVYPSREELNGDFGAGNLFVLTIGEQIVGAGAIVSARELDKAAEWEETEGVFEIARVAAGRGHQGKGYGKRIVLGLEEVIRERGGKVVHLSVAKGNLPAGRMYVSLGYAKRGEETMWGNDYDLMEKALRREEGQV